MQQGKENIERRSLVIGKWGNLLMAVSGIVASFLAHSDAILVDGLYSGVNFLGAIVAARISVSIAKPADRSYPFGYDAQEALYVTFRSLVLLGIIVFAVFSALEKIFLYASGGEVPELIFGPILVYAITMVIICLTLAAWHRRNWRLSGGQSELLRIESRAAVVDAVISGGAGAGLLAASLLRGTALAGVVPVADAIIVIVMCSFLVRDRISFFLAGLKEVAGATAHPVTVEKVRSCFVALLQGRPFTLLDVAVTKMGRSHMVLSYIKPNAPIDGETADLLWRELDEAAQGVLSQAKTEIIIAGKSPYSE